MLEASGVTPILRVGFLLAVEVFERALKLFDFALHRLCVFCVCDVCSASSGRGLCACVIHVFSWLRLSLRRRMYSLDDYDLPSHIRIIFADLFIAVSPAPLADRGRLERLAKSYFKKYFDKSSRSLR